MLAFGVVLLAVGLLPAATVLGPTASTLDKLKPARLLVLESRLTSGDRQREVLDELGRRHDAAALDPSEFVLFVERLLAAISERPAEERWAARLDAMHQAGALTPTQAAAFVAALLALQASDPDAPGWVLPLRRLASARVLGPERERRYVDALLDLQANAPEWRSAWGESIDEAVLSGLMTPAQLERCFQDAATLDIQVLERRRRVAPIVLAVDPQWSGRALKGFGVTLRLGRLELGPHAMSRKSSTTEALLPGSGGSTLWLGEYELEPGEHAFRLEGTVELSAPRAMSAGSPLLSRRLTRAWAVTVVPDDADIVRLVDDPETRATVAERMVLERLRIRPTPSGQGPADEWEIRLSFRNPRVEVDLAFEVVARFADGEEFSLLELVRHHADEEPDSFGWVTWVRESRVRRLCAGDPFDLVLRPGVEEAERTPGVERIWSGTAVYRGLRLEKANAGWWILEGEPRPQTHWSNPLDQSH